MKHACVYVEKQEKYGLLNEKCCQGEIRYFYLMRRNTSVTVDENNLKTKCQLLWGRGCRGEEYVSLRW